LLWRRERIDIAGIIPYRETPTSNPASSKATRNRSGNAYARMTGGPSARAAAKVRDLRLPVSPSSDNDGDGTYCPPYSMFIPSWKKLTSNTDAPAMLEPMAQKENISTKLYATDPPTCPSTAVASTLVPSAFDASTTPRKMASHKNEPDANESRLYFISSYRVLRI
jgi:hypothetical protein